MPKRTISRELLNILACPVCKKDLKLKKNELICTGCSNRYPIVDGIPYLLPPELMPEKYRRGKRARSRR